MGSLNVFFSFAFLARFCVAVFAFSSALTFAAAWDGDRYIRVDSHSSGKEVWQKNPWFGQPMKNGQAINKTGSLQPQYKNKPLPPVPVTVSATPDAVKAGVKNLLRGGLAGVAITEGIGALFDGVDWLLDPANHQVMTKKDMPLDSYKDKPAPDGCYFRRQSGSTAGYSTLNSLVSAMNLSSNCLKLDNIPTSSTNRKSRWTSTSSSSCGGTTYGLILYCPDDSINVDDFFKHLAPASPQDLDSLVDNNYNLHSSDISQLVAERSQGAFVKPNVVFIGETPEGTVSLSQFPVSDVSNTETVTIPHPNSSSTESMTMNYNYDGKNLPVTVPPNSNSSQNFTMDIVKNITTTLDFNGTNQPAKSITYNSNSEKYELSEPLSESDTPALSYTVVNNETYVVNGDTVYNSSTSTSYENDNEIVVKDSIFPPFCDWASVVCDFIAWFTEPPEPPEDGDFESLRPVDLQIGNLELDILEADKNCPAPKELTIASLNTTLTFKYDQICSAVEAINPFFLIICYISAARIVLRA